MAVENLHARDFGRKGRHLGAHSSEDSYWNGGDEKRTKHSGDKSGVRPKHRKNF